MHKHDDSDHDLYAWLRDPEPEKPGAHPFVWAILVSLAIWGIGIYACSNV